MKSQIITIIKQWNIEVDKKGRVTAVRGRQKNDYEKYNENLFISYIERYKDEKWCLSKRWILDDNSLCTEDFLQNLLDEICSDKNILKELLV